MSISHEREYAVAIAFGIRTLGGAFVFPVDIEARLDDRERQILARMRRLRDLERRRSRWKRPVDRERVADGAARADTP